MHTEAVRVIEKGWQWPAALGYGLLSMFLGMIVGFLPQWAWEELLTPKFLNTGFVVGLPVGFLAASLGVGYICFAKLDASGVACYAWIFGVCWLSFGVIGTASGWSSNWSHIGRWDYAFSNAFAFPHSCGETECLGLLFYTAPCVCTIGFSLGARIAAKHEGRKLEAQNSVADS